MKRLATVLLAATALAQPALCDIYLDGGTNITADGPPYFQPSIDPVTGESGARSFIIYLQIQSFGQKASGYVTPFVIMFPQDDYSASVRVRLTQSQYTGGHPDGQGWDCPELNHLIETKQGYNTDGSLNDAQVETWLEEDCSLRPAPDLFNSGVLMGLEASFQDDTNNNINNGIGHWLVAQQDNFVPMDGNPYFVIIFGNTGSLLFPPWVNFFVQQHGAWSGTIVSPTYQDSSYYYATAPDGFSVPSSNMIYQLGCETVDPTWVDTCYNGNMGVSYFFPSVYEQEVIPYNALLAKFVTIDGRSEDLNYDCTAPLGFPPELCNFGTPDQYLRNRADFAAGLLISQTYTVNGWTFTPDLNPNYDFLGGQLRDAGDNFH